MGPLIEEENEFGICDECGEYVESLVLTEGDWVSEHCERYR